MGLGTVWPSRLHGVQLEGGGDRPCQAEGPGAWAGARRGAHLALAGAGADVAVCILSVERVREEA